MLVRLTARLVAAQAAGTAERPSRAARRPVRVPAHRGGGRGPGRARRRAGAARRGEHRRPAGGAGAARAGVRPPAVRAPLLRGAPAGAPAPDLHTPRALRRARGHPARLESGRTGPSADGSRPLRRGRSRREPARGHHRPRGAPPAPRRHDARPGPGDPHLPGRSGQPHRRPPRAEPGRRRAHHRPAPGVRVPARRDRLRHRAPVLRAQAAHRPARLLRAAHPRRDVGVPEPGRVRARRGRELARVLVAVVGRRHRQGPCAAGRDRPHHRGRHRRRRPHRRDGLGGAEQHRHGSRPPARDRGQRQRALVRADHRRPGPPPRHAAHHPRLRALPRLGQEHAAAQRPARDGWRSRRCTA